MERKFLLLLISIFYSNASLAQDVIQFSEREALTGEIRSLSNSVLTIRTKYSSDDFTIVWSKVKQIKSNRTFLVVADLDTGKSINHYGSIVSINDSLVAIRTNLNVIYKYPINNIIILRPLGDDFKSRFNGKLSIGFDHTKANNLQSWTTNNEIGYSASQWILKLSYEGLRSSQKNSPLILRNEALFSAVHLLTESWYTLVIVNNFTNNVLNLDYRLNTLVGCGFYMVRSNTTDWSLFGGFNRNFEGYSNITENRESLESVLGTHLSLYNIKNFGANLEILSYPGFTEGGRFRTDASFDVFFALFSQFIFNVNFSYNFDNRPALDANDADYVVSTGFGWKF